jgi:hypothetical protein
MALVYAVQDEDGSWLGADPERADWTKQGQVHVGPATPSTFAGRVVDVRYGAIESGVGRRVELLDGTALYLTAEVDELLF